MIWIILILSCNLAFAQYNNPYLLHDYYDLIIEYEQECFADSSYELVFPKLDKTYLVYTEPYYAWVHKEPSWEGFREFVKRKQQKLGEVK